MSKRTGGLRTAGQTRRGKVVSPFGASANNLLTIPSLEESIPREFQHDHCATKWAKLALLWLDAGELTGDDSGHPLELTKTAVTRWMDRQMTGIQHLNVIDVVVHADPSEIGDIDQLSGFENNEPLWAFGMVLGGALNWFELEKRVNALDQAHPGLGQAAVKLFQARAWRLLPIFTPEQARCTATYTWWCGMDSQEDYLAEREAMGYEDDEDESGISPDAFDSKFPGWFFSHEATVALAEPQLQSIVASSESENARAVASLMLELLPIEPDSYRLPWLGGDISPIHEENAYFLAYIRWNQDDPMSRLDDDHINDANQSGDGFTEYFGADAVSFDAAKFKKWKAELERGFDVLRKLDALLPLIADPCWE